MKFLCDQCKAKYQISDEKVAGKTVRMKCRKCGHQIEVRAAVTESSVSTALPQSDAPPAAGGGGAGSGGAGTGGPARPSSAPAAPRPGTGTGAPRPGGLATSLAAARPAAPRAPQAPQGGALAGAFKSSVQKDGDEAAAAMELLELSSADEWYCAINGVPVGPIRMTELRRKAALGAVTEDSLVWQEGLEEWRIAKTIPELAAIIREASTSGRPSLVTPQPPDTGGRASIPPPGPSPSMRPGPQRPLTSPPGRGAPEAPRAPLTAARSNVVPITSRLATAEKLEEAMELAPAGIPDRVSVAADPFAAPPPAARLSSPPGSVSTSTAALMAAASLPAPIEAKRSSPPPWIAIAMVVLAAAFGITAAIAIFLRPPQQAAAPQPVVIQVPGAPAPVQAPAPVASAAPADTGTAAIASASKPGAGAHGAVAAKAAPSSTGAGAAGVDPSVANLLRGVSGGPSTGGGGGGGGGGSSLTADQVEGVVRNHSLAVRRTCWERGGSSSPSANITVSVTVGGTGAVQNASANGNDPVVAKCIEGAVRSWQFPPTGGTTTVNIPFHFVRQ